VSARPRFPSRAERMREAYSPNWWLVAVVRVVPGSCVSTPTLYPGRARARDDGATHCMNGPVSASATDTRLRTSGGDPAPRRARPRSDDRIPATSASTRPDRLSADLPHVRA